MAIEFSYTALAFNRWNEKVALKNSRFLQSVQFFVPFVQLFQIIF